MKSALLLVCGLSAVSASVWAAPFEYSSTLSLGGAQFDSSSGGTFLQFMEAEVKPAMDRLATDGYKICKREVVAEAYEASDQKVKTKVDRNFDGIDSVLEIVDKLNERLGRTKVTAKTLPGEIRAVAPRAKIYDLANFIGLACGGGVRVDFAPGNYALNVHYDVTEQKSGRSYGVGPSRGANDASDKEYLNDIESYSKTEREDLKDFYKAMFGALLQRDGTGFRKVADEGQTVLTDFLAVFTAEQARNLMDGEVSPHWDAALLEVTLLSGFHAGQSTMKLYYKNPGTGEVTFTDSTLRQTPCSVPTASKAASMNDYWQFSRNITDPANCKRSGINVTKGEFRKLGAAITAYMKINHEEAFQQVVASMYLTTSRNVYQSLSSYLIGPNAPRELAKTKASKITKAWAEFLSIAQEEADAISSELE